jgi:hypothetical protein
MLAEGRKLHIIEAVLRTDNDATLSAIEAIVEKDSNKVEGVKTNFNDLLGVLTHDEAEAMKQVIEETYEKINPDDWK